MRALAEFLEMLDDMLAEIIAPVDVLAVLDRIVARDRDAGIPTIMTEAARAAVADLFEANETVIAALKSPGAPTKTERDEMIACLSAALTGAGGAK